MSSYSLQSIAFILSLVSGIILLVGSLFMFLLSAFGSPYQMYYGMGGMMGHMGFGYNYPYGWMIALPLVSLVCGILVLIGAIMLRARPKEHFIWGTIILVFAIISFMGLGGYFIGAITGITGGALALSYKEPNKK